jgi:hypothetical protein
MLLVILVCFLVIHATLYLGLPLSCAVALCLLCSCGVMSLLAAALQHQPRYLVAPVPAGWNVGVAAWCRVSSVEGPPIYLPFPLSLFILMLLRADRCNASKDSVEF